MSNKKADVYMANGTMTLDDVRIMLSEEIRRLRSGDTNAANVNAISNATGKYLSSIKLELEIHKLMGKQPNVRGVIAEGKQDAK